MRIERRMQRVCPGASMSIGAVQDSSGEVHTDDSSMARALEQHWSQTFRHQPIDRGKLDSWLSDVPDFPAHVSEDVDEKTITQAIQYANDSAPGPDGIPYAAYKLFPWVPGLFRECLRSLARCDGWRQPSHLARERRHSRNSPGIQGKSL